MTEYLHKAFFWLLGANDPATISGARDWQWYTVGPDSPLVLGTLAVLALVAAGVNLLPGAGMPWRIRAALTVLRLLGFACLVLLVIQLELRVTVERSLPPNVAILMDRSDSMSIQDSRMPAGQGGEVSRRDAADAFRKQVIDQLGGDAFVANYDFDWTARRAVLAPAVAGSDEPGGPDGGTSMTRIMDSLRDVLRAERDLQSVVLLTDGNDTGGDEGAAVAPMFAARGVPVYPVTFGEPDTPYAPSVRFTGGGDYVRLGDDLRLEATLSAPGFEGRVVQAKLYQGEAKNPLFTRDVKIRDRPSTIEFVFKPEKPGRKIYRIEVDGLKEAPTRKLLVARHQVDVIDQKIRVLYVDIPRDERKIVGHWLARDPVIDFAGLLLLPKQGWFAQGQMRHRNKRGLPDEEADLYEYDVIIFGDIPRRVFRQGDPEETRMRWLVEFVQRRGGGLITLGGRSVYGAGLYGGSALAAVMPFTVESTRKPQIDKTFNVIPTAFGFSHPIMRLERDFEANRNAWLDLPKIEGCNRVGKVRPGASLLANNQTPEDGNLPAIALQNTGKGKVLAMTIDTTWRWEMQRPRGSEAENVPEGTDYFRRFWGNAVRYLAPDPRLQPELPRIARRKSDIAVGETVTLSTRLVDRLFKPIRNADLTIRVKAPSGSEYRIFPSDGRREPGLYEYDVAIDEPGTWTVTAAHKEDEVLAAIAKAEAAVAKADADEDDVALSAAKHALAVAKAKIAREELRAGDSTEELEDPRARPYAMQAFAAATGGTDYTPDQLDALLDEMRLARHSIARSYAFAIWNLPALMILLIVIVCLDCYLRKRRGLV